MSNTGADIPRDVNVSTLSRTVLLASIVAAAAGLGMSGCSSSVAASRQILFMSDRDGEWALYAMDADGRNQRRVLTAGNADPFGSTTGVGEPAVSPDGRQVLLARRGVSVARR